MFVKARFYSDGSPATGLSPTVTITEVPGGTVAVNAAAMSELGLGAYYYEFTAYDAAKNYDVLCDGGSSLIPGERYADGGTTVDGEVQQILDDMAVVIPTGARTIGMTVFRTGSTTPIPGAKISVYPSSSTVLATIGSTDVDGALTLGLDDGTYNVILSCLGYDFSGNPHTLVVSADASVTYYGDALSIPVPVDADTCRVYEYCFDQSGQSPMESVTATAQIIYVPCDVYDRLYSDVPVTGTYDADTGLLYWDIVRGARALFYITELGISEQRTIPDTAIVRLSEIEE